MSTVQDASGSEHIVFQQYYGDLPVWGHDMVVHFDSSGRLYAINARYGPTPRALPQAAAIDEKQAIDIAVDHLAGRMPIDILPDWIRQALNYAGPEARPYIWVEEATQRPHRVWYVQIRPNLRDRWFYFVDAGTGEILQSYNAAPSSGPTTATAVDLDGVSRSIDVYEANGSYYLIDASRPIFKAVQPNILNSPQGALWTLDGHSKDLSSSTTVSQVSSRDNIWNDPVAVSAHYHVGLVFDYLLRHAPPPRYRRSGQ